MTTSMSVVAGYAFNRARLDDDVVGIAAVPYRLEADNSFVWRAGVNVGYAVAERVAVIGFAGYLVTRPDLRLVTPSGVTSRWWKADSLVLSVGAVYTLF